MQFELFVPGIARPAGSKNAFKHPKTGKIIVTSNVKTKDWMGQVRWFAMKQTRMIPTEEAVILKLTFMRERPKSHYGSGRNVHVMKQSAPPWLTQTPDLTKMVRAVEDALTGIVWKDDKQVVAQLTNKRYCVRGEISGVHIFAMSVHDVMEYDYGKEKNEEESRQVSKHERPGQSIVRATRQGQDQLHLTLFERRGE